MTDHADFGLNRAAIVNSARAIVENTAFADGNARAVAVAARNLYHQLTGENLPVIDGGDYPAIARRTLAALAARIVVDLVEHGAENPDDTGAVDAFQEAFCGDPRIPEGAHAPLGDIIVQVVPALVSAINSTKG